MEWPAGMEDNTQSLYPTDLLFAQALMHQQCWCWGQDVRRAEGNLLLERGFLRYRPPEEGSGATHYALRLDCASDLSLWGFGVAIAVRGIGSLYLNRYQMTPCFGLMDRLTGPIYRPEELSVVASIFDSRTRRLSWLARQWIADYEDWVLDELGLAYRMETLRTWHEPVIDPTTVPDLWRSLRISA